MGNLKDNMNHTSKTVTMSAADIQLLTQLNAYVQQELDVLQNKMAGMYLNHLAIDKFGMDPNKDYHFEFHPDREFENLTITETEK